MKKSLLLKNTLIILIIGFIVKLIGMFGKIATTRILGIEGMSMYVLSYPTLLLFVNISGFSLNNTISKLVSEAIASKKYSPKKILYNSIKISLLISFICIIVYLSSIKMISKLLLKNEELFYPLLTGVILIPLVGISDALRGYFNGIKQINYASISLLLEQITRTTISVLGVMIGVLYSNIIATSFLFIALAFGEIASIIYCLIKLKKNPPIDIKNTTGENKIIFKTAFSLTLSRIIGSISFFLEPIIYTFILSYLNYDTGIIHSTYTTIDAFVIPLLTIISFIPFSLSTAIIPHISEANAKNDHQSLNYFINRAYTFTIYPATLCLLIITIYHNELMLIIYNSSVGAELSGKVSMFFLFYYINAITSSILQALGAVKELFINSFAMNLLRLFLIIVLSFFPTINLLSILFSIIITSFISTVNLFITLFRKIKYKINISNILIYFLISLSTFFILLLFNHFNLNFIISIILCTLYFSGLFILKIKNRI